MIYPIWVILVSIDFANIVDRQRNLPDMIKTSITEVLLLALLLATPTAQAVVVLDFEDFGSVDFTHGTVVNSQYNLAPYGNVTISADNFTNDVDLAVAFNSGQSNAQFECLLKRYRIVEFKWWHHFFNIFNYRVDDETF